MEVCLFVFGGAIDTDEAFLPCLSLGDLFDFARNSLDHEGRTSARAGLSRGVEGFRTGSQPNTEM